MVLSADYFSPEDEIKRIESVLTIVGGKVVYGAEEFEVSSPALTCKPGLVTGQDIWRLLPFRLAGFEHLIPFVCTQRSRALDCGQSLRRTMEIGL